MKYALLIGDGMADFPIPELGGKTPLEYAKTPNMDTIAAQGQVGLVATIPDGLPPGSDVANMSLLGYDPARHYQGRAPIEAASMGVALAAGETAFRCNLVAIENGTMADYSAGHIETAESTPIIADLKKDLDSATVTFHPGVSYRHLTIISGLPDKALACTPPHSISGKPIAPYLPQGPGAETVIDIMNKARGPLSRSQTNRERKESGKTAVTDIWLWGQGRALVLPKLKDRFGLSGSVISAVDLVRGLGVLAGMTVRKVAGATGYLGTNYAGKVAAAREALTKEDLVYLHVEAPDETSHEGSLKKKIQAIEEFDANIVGPLLALRKNLPDLRIMVLPDHATPVSTRDHHAMPVPFAVCGAGIAAGTARGYSEKTAANARFFTGVTLFDEFVRGSFAQ
jgi:2,3-bisphosphoglycerate-independent phosphoglycerate mutase